MDQAHIYRDHADDYEALIAAEDARGELAALLTALMPAGGTLVDVGTGTGRIARMLAARAGRIVGVERAPAMLAVARDKPPAPPRRSSCTKATRATCATSRLQIERATPGLQIAAPTS